MDYALCKELKEAGFKQFGRGVYWAGGPAAEYKKEAYIPTLEELIEACEERFGHLGRNGAYHKAPAPNTAWAAWEANSGNVYGGATPTEAVARLWLVLNKK